MLYLKAREGIEKLEEWKGRKGKFVKVFLISDQRNKNGWRVTWESILKEVYDFRQKPGIEYIKCVEDECDLDHTEASTYEDNIEIQEKYRVSTIVDFIIDENTHTAYAIHEIIDDEFAKKLERGEVRYVSPSIWPRQGQYKMLERDAEGRMIIDVYGWRAIHTAWINKPAFGDDAKVVAQCDGEGHACKMQMLNAKESLAAEDELEPLKEVPLLLRHNDKHVFVSVSQCVMDKLQKLGNSIKEGDVIFAYAECLDGSSSGSSNDDGNSSSTPKTACCQKSKKLNALYQKISILEKKIKLQSISAAIYKIEDKIR